MKDHGRGTSVAIRRTFIACCQKVISVVAFCASMPFSAKEYSGSILIKSKIYLSMGYLRTGRCPEINRQSNGTERGPLCRTGQGGRSSIDGETMRDN
jgi:hypothetical protein